MKMGNYHPDHAGVIYARKPKLHCIYLRKEQKTTHNYAADSLKERYTLGNAQTHEKSTENKCKQKYKLIPLNFTTLQSFMAINAERWLRTHYYVLGEKSLKGRTRRK